MQNLYENEIQELHAFFEQWYRGSVENSDEIFRRLEDVLAPAFTLITSSGYSIGREQLLELLRIEYATKPDIKIRVENCQKRFTDGDIILVNYEEHGISKNQKKSTLITAVMRKNNKQPNNLEWMHIHEVGLPT